MSRTTDHVIDIRNAQPLPTSIDLANWGLTLRDIRSMTIDEVKAYFTATNVAKMFGYCDETDAELARYAELAIEQGGHTVCRYYELCPVTGIVQNTGQPWYAFENPSDRLGDGHAEIDAYLEALRDGGFDVVERTDVDVEGADVAVDQIRVFEYDGGCAGTGMFGLAVVDRV